MYDLSISYAERYFRLNGRDYLSEDYGVAYFNNSYEAGCAVQLLLQESIGFHVIVGPGEVWVVVDEYSFHDFGFKKSLENNHIAHEWVKSPGVIMAPMMLR